MIDRTRTQRAIAHVLRLAFVGIMRLGIAGRVRIRGADHIPPSGSVLVVSNHIGAGDPAIIWAIYPRQLWFMAMDSLFQGRFLGPPMRAAGAFSVRRDSPDRRALRTASDLLRAGESVAIFPEGERTVGAVLSRPRDGAAYLAMREHALILPVGLAGTERLFPRVRMRPKQRGIDVNIGPAFRIPEDIRDRAEATALIMERIAALLPVAYRGDVEGEVPVHRV